MSSSENLPKPPPKPADKPFRNKPHKKHNKHDDQRHFKFSRKRLQSCGNGKNPKRRKTDFVPPTKFLLGGNICDPLNLNSMRDEEVNRAMNAVTPKSSPLPTPKHRKGKIEVIIPNNMHDPLNLNGDNNEVYQKLLASPTKKATKRRNNKKRKRQSSSGSAKEDTTANTSEMSTNESEKKPEVVSAPEEAKVDTPQKKMPKLKINEDFKDKRTRKLDVKDKIVSPVIPQPGTWNPRSHEKKKKKVQQVPPVFKPNNKKFEYGNYNRYYGYRNPGGFASDLRLGVFSERRELFVGKDVLDIGCNTGIITLAVARDFGVNSITGIDIDKKLINIARNNVKHYANWEKSPRIGDKRGGVTEGGTFPICFPVCFGPIDIPGFAKHNKDQGFPHNVTFVQGNYVLDNDLLLKLEQPQFDTILCLSTTKWIHLNFGDEGLKQAFKRMYAQLRPNGVLILESQSFDSYNKKKNLTERIHKNFQDIELLPQHFAKYLVSDEVGFRDWKVWSTPRHPSKGFQRPILVFTKPGDGEKNVSEKAKPEPMEQGQEAGEEKKTDQDTDQKMDVEGKQLPCEKNRYYGPNGVYRYPHLDPPDNRYKSPQSCEKPVEKKISAESDSRQARNPSSKKCEGEHSDCQTAQERCCHNLPDDWVYEQRTDWNAEHSPTGLSISPSSFLGHSPPTDPRTGPIFNPIISAGGNIDGLVLNPTVCQETSPSCPVVISPQYGPPALVYKPSPMSSEWNPISPKYELKTSPDTPSPHYPPCYSPTSPTYTPANVKHESSNYSPVYSPLSPTYSPTSPNYGLESPSYSPKSPKYSPTSPNYGPASPSYSPTSPKYSLASPNYSPTNPKYSPTSPNYSPASPDNSPTSPTYTPTSVNHASPNYVPSDSPASPTYTPASVNHAPPNYVPSDSPASPDYRPTSPTYTPASVNHASPNYSPASPNYTLPSPSHGPASSSNAPASANHASPNYGPSYSPASPIPGPPSPSYSPASPNHGLASSSNATASANHVSPNYDPNYSPASPIPGPPSPGHSPASPNYTPTSLTDSLEMPSESKAPNNAPKTLKQSPKHELEGLKVDSEFPGVISEHGPEQNSEGSTTHSMVSPNYDTKTSNFDSSTLNQVPKSPNNDSSSKK